MAAPVSLSRWFAGDAFTDTCEHRHGLLARRLRSVSPRRLSDCTLDYRNFLTWKQTVTCIGLFRGDCSPLRSLPAVLLPSSFVFPFQDTAKAGGEARWNQYYCEYDHELGQ
jgi:hypothetical protein